MIPFQLLIAICWIIFFIVWFIYSLKTKKTIRGKNDRIRSWIRFILFAAIIWLFNTNSFRELNAYHLFPFNQWVQGIGVVLCAAGIAFAIWARVHIGRNWGMPMSLKENPELVTTGPYHYIRHPIYTGIYLATLGSMISAGMLWLIWFIFWCVYIIYSAKKEEKTMMLQFPEEYPAYMKRTKMLIPFIL